jgi:hypothetical protein
MNRKSAIRVGDHVRFLFGVRTVIGIVDEDRGAIGYKGRNLYRIQFSGGLYVPEPFYVELPAEEFTLVSKEEAAAAAADL